MTSFQKETEQEHRETNPSEKMLSVVIPVFNEGDHLQQVIETVSQTLDNLSNPYEVILVDDGSTDNTWLEIEKIAGHHPKISGLKLSRNFGKEAALAAGLETAEGDGVLIMDGDLQHPPDLIATMVAHWQRGDAEIVEAVKTKRGSEPWWHRLCAALFYRLLIGIPGTGLAGATDFKLLDRRVVQAWRSMGERNIFFRGMAAWLGFSKVEIPFAVPARIGGESRWRPLKLFALAITGITSFTTFPLQITTVIGFCFFIFSILLGSHTLYVKFTGQAVSGFATVILLILILGSCLLISLGIVGMYIARIYEEVKARPRYLVTDRCGNQPDGTSKPRSSKR